MEEIVAGIWSEVLKLDHVGSNENFFLLGGHSLLVTQMISRVREVFRVELPVRSMFEASTLGEFAERVETEREMAQVINLNRSSHANVTLRCRYPSRSSDSGFFTS